ncbi:hypothetical protein NI17_006120 [Thermobifida halotolerans]|uniref:Uncharacterized protein n=1 Tax=Thermobifida halotolerans TaxID=483545 RepID=A0A399G4Q5_9ACTN|nr:hypothetical protein [Thermobifida halotolerans]UOE20770.1 hypothetical protein NI17_006120 [Thermobifida halotolerans]
MTAYAICVDADSVPGWHINPEYTGSTSDAVQRETVGCGDPNRQRVVGTGARIDISPSYQGEVVLQMARASGTGDIARAQSHEDADGFPGPTGWPSTRSAWTPPRATR